METVDLPFLSLPTIHYHLDKTTKVYPNLENVCKLIKKHVHVYDLMAAVNSTTEAIMVRELISAKFSKTKIKIQKWTSNSSDLLKTIPDDERSPIIEIMSSKGKQDCNEDSITFSDPEIVSQTTKCLGMTWSPNEDLFYYKTYENLEDQRPKKLAKRGISSLIPLLYDQTRLLQPFIVRGKLILQSAWTHKDKKGNSLNWDDTLPDEIKEPWMKWIKDIMEISQFTTNRYIFTNLEIPPSREDLYLHCLADAGKKA